MNPPEKTGNFGARLAKITLLNFAVALSLGFAFWFFQKNAAQKALPEELISSLIHASIYGVMFGLLMPYIGERLTNLRVPWNWIFIVSSLLIIAASSTLLIELLLLKLGFLTFPQFLEEYFFKSFGVFLIALIIGLGIYAYENFRDRIQATNLQLREHELEKEQAFKLATEARLASLESRLHPHFLFNTLNSISALISEDPLLADLMVQRLASLLRASLDACEKSILTLDEEIKLVTNYLEIEKARFRERLKFSINVEPEIMFQPVPPLILQPIVENSVKFAVSPMEAGGEIKITARRENGNMILEVCDDGQGFNEEMIPSGHGLDNLQSRLVALFGGNANLSVYSQNGGTSVKISLPLKSFPEKK
jgi:sensor histidine kinase YesM